MWWNSWSYPYRKLTYPTGSPTTITGSLKPRPNDGNISTQHIPAFASSGAPNDRNIWTQRIATCNMLHLSGHPVATYCDMLRVENRTSAHGQAQHCWTTWPNDCNNMQHPQILHEKFDHFKFEPTAPNMSQHGTTRWPSAPNNVAICCFVWPGLNSDWSYRVKEWGRRGAGGGGGG